RDARGSLPRREMPRRPMPRRQRPAAAPTRPHPRICARSVAHATIHSAVPSRWVFAFLSLACACREGAATPAHGLAQIAVPALQPQAPMPASPPPTEASAAPRNEGTAERQNAPPASSAVVATSGLAASVGQLQGAAHLTHVFETLARLEDGHAHDDVRILQ